MNKELLNIPRPNYSVGDYEYGAKETYIENHLGASHFPEALGAPNLLLVFGTLS
jgi:hypothetical protein